MPAFRLKYGSTHLAVEVPAANLEGVIEAREQPGLPDPDAAIRAAIAGPVAGPSLAGIVRPGDRVAVVVSDITRPAPSHLLVPPVLDALNAVGVPDSHITVIFALGIHRPHTPAERERLVGAAVTRRVRCIDSDPSDCVRVGVTSRGTIVRATRSAVNADVRVCTGNVEYHWFAGYSGGAKALVPGVCDRATISANHSLMLQPGAEQGRIDGNPLREDIEEAGALIGADFAVNVALNSRREIVAAFAGRPLDVLRAGARAIDSMYAIPIERQADVVIASPGGSPKDMNLYQAQKAIDNARFAVRPGGALILAAECREGLGEEVFEQWMDEAREPADLVRRLRAGFVVGGHKAAALGMAAVHAPITLVSAMPPERVRRLFLTPAASLDEALAMAFERLGSGASVLVMPNAGSTLPRTRAATPV